MTSPLRVLVACEFSGIVRDAFIARGHTAWSCDLLPSEANGPHIQGDVVCVLKDGWDLMIAHPPCTHLAVSGARYFKNKQHEQKEALNFVRTLLEAPIPKIALENPVSIISTKIRKPDQIIHPWQFGHDEAKTTCLWLKGLPPLVSTYNLIRPAWVPCPQECDDFVCRRHQMHTADCECPDLDTWVKNGDDPYRVRYSNQTPSGQNKLGPSPTRAKERGRTYPGIAFAMAAQWGIL